MKIKKGFIGQKIKDIDIVKFEGYVQYNVYLENGKCICIEIMNNALENGSHVLFED